MLTILAPAIFAAAFALCAFVFVWAKRVLSERLPAVWAAYLEAVS